MIRTIVECDYCRGTRGRTVVLRELVAGLPEGWRIDPMGRHVCPSCQEYLVKLGAFTSWNASEDKTAELDPS